MLVLTRNCPEKVVIYTKEWTLEVRVQAVQGPQVKLGISAPAALAIERPEAKNKQPKKRAPKPDLQEKADE